jgi:hypothetical protein
MAPAARLLARAGSDGHGGTLTVRSPDEVIARPAGSRLGEHDGDVHLALWRRGAATGKRMVKSALALGELRRETDRELARRGATAVRDKIGELESTLATAARKKDGKTALPGQELARLSTEHARLSALWTTCTSAQGELRTAEELCLEALARDVDAVDLIDAAVLQRQQFRRDLFWLLVGLRPQRPGITMMVHTPDAKAALVAWVKLVLAAAAHHGWRASVHIYGERQSGWPHDWGPPHDRQWAEDRLSSAGPTAALVRVVGVGSDLLFGLEAGLQRFTGLAGEPCHVWVDLLEPKTELTDLEWATLPTPPQARPARGNPMREHVVNADRVLVGGEEIEPPWSELPERLAEASVARLLEALDHDGHGCRYDELGKLWFYDNPLAKLTAAQGKPP